MPYKEVKPGFDFLGVHSARRPAKALRGIHTHTFVIPTAKGMDPLSDILREPENEAVTPSMDRKPPPIYLGYPPSEANSCVIRKWLSGLKVAASHRRFNELQYILFPHDEQDELITHMRLDM